MADYRRNDSDERRGQHRGRASMFGSSWGRGDRGRDDERGEHRHEAHRDDPGYERSRSAGWFGRDLSLDHDREQDRERGDRSGHRGHRGDWSFDRHPGGDRMQRNRDYGRDDRHEGLPIEETSRLIASNKVEGTPVYSRDRQRLGTIYNFMVDKISGQVEYAVMRYGGFLGMGQRYYPLPWRVLTYHRDAGGYVIDMLARDFEDAPSFDRDDEPEFDRAYGRRVHGWYGLDY